MTDPLSITASALTVLGAAVSAAKSINDIVVLIQDVPKALEALSTEIKNITVVVDLVRRSADDLEPDAGEDSIKDFLSQAEVKLTELNQLISKFKGIKLHGFPKGAHLRWLRDEKRILRIYEDLQKVRKSLDSSVASQTLVSVSRILSRQDELVQSANDQKQLLYTVQSTQQTLLKIIDTRAPSATLGRSNTVRTVSPSNPQLAAYNRVGLGISTFMQVGCGTDCPCACHEKSLIRSSRKLGAFAGLLTITYSGLRMLSRPCDTMSCAGRNSWSFTISYRFPELLSMRMISMALGTTPIGDPIASLKPRTVISNDSLMFAYASAGNVEGMKTLFSKRLGSPNDILDSEPSYSVLQWVTIGGDTECVNLLLQQGADPQFEDAEGKNANWHAWNSILRTRFSTTGRDFDIIFDREDALQSGGYHEVHRIIFGFYGEDYTRLFEGLKKHELNYTDFEGKTALDWAMERRDVKATHALLSKGATPRSDSLTRTLHKIDKSRKTIELFVEAGCDINFVDDYHGVCALMWECRGGDSPHVVEALLDNGADINHVGPFDCEAVICGTSDPLGFDMPLNIAIRNWEGSKITSVLLDRGADLSGMAGFRAIVHAVAQNEHQILKLLLEKGVDYRESSKTDVWPIKHRFTRKLDSDEIQYFDNGVTILHIAAYHADIETFNILKAARLTLDGNSLEDNGLSPRNYLHLRTVLEAEVEEAFDSLLASLLWTAPAESGSCVVSEPPITPADPRESETSKAMSWPIIHGIRKTMLLCLIIFVAWLAGLLSQWFFTSFFRKAIA